MTHRGVTVWELKKIILGFARSSTGRFIMLGRTITASFSAAVVRAAAALGLLTVPSPPAPSMTLAEGAGRSQCDLSLAKKSTATGGSQTRFCLGIVIYKTARAISLLLYLRVLNKPRIRLSQSPPVTRRKLRRRLRDGCLVAWAVLATTIAREVGPGLRRDGKLTRAAVRALSVEKCHGSSPHKNAMRDIAVPKI